MILAKDQLDALQKVHDSPSKHRLAGLYRQFHCFEAGTRSIDDAVAHLNSLQYDIWSIRPAEASSDFVKAITLLDGLGSEYRVLNTVLSNDDSLTFESTVARLTEEEQAQKKNVLPVTRALYTHKRQRKTNSNVECYSCGQPGHIAPNCPDRDDQNSSERSWQPYRADRCGRGRGRGRGTGHKLPSRQFAAIAQPKTDYNTEHAWMVSLSLIGTNPSSDWVIDSGASNHMAGSRALFISYRQLPAKIDIYTANSSSTPAIGVGKVRVRLAGGQQVTIQEVYHVPGLEANLLSVAQLADRGLEVQMQPNCVLLLQDGKTIATGARSGQRYILAAAAAQHVALATEVRPNPESFDLWHRRFGHIGQDRLRQLHAVTVGLISPIGQPIDNADYAICLHAKQAKIVNRVAPERATKTLERVYTDFCGPIEPTIDEEVYILTFVDEFSPKAWVYPVKKRTDLYGTFANWKAYIELQSGNRLVALRADNASEYRTLEALLAKEGVAVEFTVAYTPEQNGVAERLNRTIFTLVWALLEQAKLPDPFWGLGAKAAAYIRNRAPVAEHNKTPEGVWTGKEPYIGHMRVFGCLAYMLNTHPATKLASRSIQGVFVGYSRSAR